MQDLVPFLSGILLKGAVVLSVALVVVLLLRRGSAATRHLVWTMAMAGALVLPLLSFLLPGWSAGPVVSVVASVREAVEKTPAPVQSTMPHPESLGPPASIPVPAGPVPSDSLAGPSHVQAGEPIPGTPAAPSAVVAREVSAVPAGRLLPQWLPWAWLVGVSIALGPLILGWLALFQLRRSARPVTDPVWLSELAELRAELGIRRKIRLWESSLCGMPMTWGANPLACAKIMVPEGAVAAWSEDRRRAVLLHELAHVKRRDCLSQTLAQVSCAIHWCNPLLWIAAYRMVVERERACDDLALQHKAQPSEYARHLLEIATHRQHVRFATRAGIAMARRSSLGGRIAAILDRGRNRQGTSRAVVAFTIAALGAIVVPVAMLQGEREETRPETENTLDLRVEDGQSGEPVTGASIRVYDTGRESDLVTDADGRVLISLSEESLTYLFLRISADGYGPMRLLWRGDPVKPVGVPESYTLALHPGTTIGGRVIDDTGGPVAGATVVLHIHAESGRPHELVGFPYTRVTTDELGRWEYPSAPEQFQRVDVGVHHPDYASHDRRQARGMAGSFRMIEQPIRALREGRAEHVLERGVGVEIVVRDAHGRPAEGAAVGIGADRFASNLIPERRTGSDGRARVAVHAEDAVTLTVKYPGHAPEIRSFPAGNPPAEVEFDLSPGHLLEGKVIDPEGEPVAGARVAVDTWRDKRTLQVRFRTDENGRFEWKDAPGDRMLVDVLAHGFADVRDIAVRAGEENVIQLAPPLVVRGRVVDAVTRNPIQQFEVATAMMSYSAISDAISIAQWRPDAEAFEDEEGRFHLAPRDTHWALRVVASGYAPAESPIFSANDGSQDLTFELEPADWIEGRVVDIEGRAVGGAEVTLAFPGSFLRVRNGVIPEMFGGNSMRAISGPEGEFSFPPPSGVYGFVVLHDAGYGEVSDAEFQASGELTLQPWGRIEGIVENRNLGSSERVAAYYAGSLPRSTVAHVATVATEADGSFVIEKVPPGEIAVARMWGERQLAHPNLRALDLDPGTTAGVAMGGPGRTVVGRVALDELEGIEWRLSTARVRRLPDGAVPRNAGALSESQRRQFRHEWNATEAGQAFLEEQQRLLLMQIGNNFALRPDGAFRIENLEPGNYSLSLVFTARSPQAANVFEQVASLTHDFTIPEVAGIDEPEPLEFPMLRPNRTERNY